MWVVVLFARVLPANKDMTWTVSSTQIEFVCNYDFHTDKVTVYQ